MGELGLPALTAEDGRWTLVWEPHLDELVRAAEAVTRTGILSGLAGRYRRARLARALDQIRGGRPQQGASL